MPCPELEVLEQFSQGCAPAELSDSVRSHVAGCDSCRSLLGKITANLKLQARLAVVGSRAGPVGGIPSSSVLIPPALAHATPVASLPSLAPLPEDAIPGYSITREISRGGQAIVYQALQQSTSRKVAIKVLRDGRFAEARERARFDREVQILGQLRHPNIVTIHDSGMVGGLPYFVMAYVAGRSLDGYVQLVRQRSTEVAARGVALSRAREVIALFARVADAVNAAHLRGIIHRDLKPSNIRVDESGHPMVLDFGIAKIAAASGQLAPERTLTGEFIGSPHWASPEQASGAPERIDVRSDVYSLGVMMFHSFAGAFPYQDGGGVRELLDRIARVDPLPLYETALAHWKAEAGSTTRMDAAMPFAIDEDLETIVMRCLSKAPERRYQSAGELAEDLRRLLAGDPIAARRDSAMYVLRKTLARYRLGVGVAAAFALVIAAAAVTMGVLYRRESIQRAAAEFQQQRADDQARLAEDRRKAAETERDRTAHQAALAVEQLQLAKAARADAEKRLDEARASADLLAALLRARLDAGEAEAQFRGAVEEARLRFGDPSPSLANALHNLGVLLHAKGDLGDAERILIQSLDMRRSVLDGSNSLLMAQTLQSLADVLADQSAFRRALPMYGEALAIAERESVAPEQAARLRLGMATCLRQLANYAQAERQLTDALDDFDGEAIRSRPLRRQLIEAMVALHEQWDSAAPGGGHDDRARDWRRELEGLPAIDARPAPSSRPVD